MQSSFSFYSLPVLRNFYFLHLYSVMLVYSFIRPCMVTHSSSDLFHPSPHSLHSLIICLCRVHSFISIIFPLVIAVTHLYTHPRTGDSSLLFIHLFLLLISLRRSHTPLTPSLSLSPYPLTHSLTHSFYPCLLTHLITHSTLPFAPTHSLYPCLLTHSFVLFFAISRTPFPRGLSLSHMKVE